MADIIEGVHPTRMELLEIKKRIKLAAKGHRLLKEKRDALVTEFFEVVKKAKGLRGDLVESMDSGYSNLVHAEALMGTNSVMALSQGIPESVKVDIDLENIMGVRVPKFKTEKLVEHEETYPLLSASASLEQAMKDWDDILEKMLNLVEVEETVRRLAEEIKKTKRRVNALEYIVLPRLEATQRYIRMRLEELERENFFRLKTVKKKAK